MQLIRTLMIACALTIAMSVMAAAQSLQQGRCHMGTCSWSKILTKSTIGENDAGTLFTIALLGGESDMDDQRQSIRWNRTPHVVHVFCSLRIPLVMIPRRDELHVEFLYLTSGEVPPGALISAYQVYGSVCHQFHNTVENFEEFIKRFRYAASLKAWESIKETIKSPSDVLALKMEVEVAQGQPRIDRYLCRAGSVRFAVELDIDRGIMKMRELKSQAQTVVRRIVRDATVEECGKYGWIFSDIKLCVATKGSAEITFLEKKNRMDCDYANIR